MTNNPEGTPRGVETGAEQDRQNTERKIGRAALESMNLEELRKRRDELLKKREDLEKKLAEDEDKLNQLTEDKNVKIPFTNKLIAKLKEINSHRTARGAEPIGIKDIFARVPNLIGASRNERIKPKATHSKNFKRFIMTVMASLSLASAAGGSVDAAGEDAGAEDVAIVETDTREATADDGLEYDASFTEEGDSTGEFTPDLSPKDKVGVDAKFNDRAAQIYEQSTGKKVSEVDAQKAEQRQLMGQERAERSQDSADEAKTTGEKTTYSGELSNGVKYDYGEYANGLTYDYSQWADFDNKISHNAYGYDRFDDFNNREASIQHIMENATNSPEMLASYIFGCLQNLPSTVRTQFGITDARLDQIAQLGETDNPGPVGPAIMRIMRGIDNYMSNPDNSDGNNLREQLLQGLENILRSDNARFNYYYEGRTEDTMYVYAYDANGDNYLSPDEMHLSSDTKQRNGAPQLEIFWTDEDGIEHRVMDLNMQCGYQPNFNERNVQAAPKTSARKVTPPPAPSAQWVPEGIPEGVPKDVPKTEDKGVPEDESKGAPGGEGTPEDEGTPESNNNIPPEGEPEDNGGTPGTPENDSTTPPGEEETEPEGGVTPPSTQDEGTPEGEDGGKDTTSDNPGGDSTPESSGTPTSTDTPDPTSTPTPTPTPTQTPTSTSTPTPIPTSTPEPTKLEHKNEEAEMGHAGNRVTQLGLDETETPPTSLEQDQENFAAIEQQRRDDEAARQEAERVAAEQAKAEEEASRVAEQRRQAEEEAERQRQAEMDEQARQEREAAEAEARRQADAAAAKAAETAAAEQAAAAAAEQQRAAEAAARERAQEQANTEAVAMQEEAEQMSVNDEARDAADFASGAFDLVNPISNDTGNSGSATSQLFGGTDTGSNIQSEAGQFTTLSDIQSQTASSEQQPSIQSETIEQQTGPQTVQIEQPTAQVEQQFTQAEPQAVQVEQQAVQVEQPAVSQSEMPTDTSSRFTQMDIGGGATEAPMSFYDGGSTDFAGQFDSK